MDLPGELPWFLNPKFQIARLESEALQLRFSVSQLPDNSVEN